METAPRLQMIDATPERRDDPPSRLVDLAEQIHRGEHIPKLSVRELLSMFGRTRRNAWTVKDVRLALAKLKLITKPDFDSTFLDGFVELIGLVERTPSLNTPVSTERVVVPESPSSSGTDIEEPNYRIGRLTIAHNAPTCVSPDVAIERAITIMLQHDYSQLPVIIGERDVKGIISWKSLGSRLALGRCCKLVRDALEPHSEITEDETLFAAIRLIKERDCVLVRDSAKQLCGILTAYDISVTFGELAEPFLILSSIESHIRGLIDGKFTTAELMSVRDPKDDTRRIDNVSDLTFGEYLKLTEEPQRWQKLSLPIDRASFVKGLDDIRIIRNDVMHFDPDGLDSHDLMKLREFESFLGRLRSLLPRRLPG